MANSVGYIQKGKARTAGHVYSVQSTEALQNGFITFKGDLVEGEREIYTAKKPATADLGNDAALFIQAPEINYDESTLDKAQFGAFGIEANTPARAYDLYVGDIIEISTDGLTILSTDAVVGNYLIPQDGSYKLAESETVGTTKFTAKIIEVRTNGTLTYVGSNGRVGNQYKLVVAEVVKN
jgi:hypothetical protein